MTDPVDHVPSPMAQDALCALVRSALDTLGTALADGDGNQDRPPYNLATLGGTVNHELVVAYSALEHAYTALAGQARNPKEVPWPR